MARKKDKNNLQELQGKLGALLIEYRESAGYSISQTADALCLPEATISKLENEDFETLAEPPYIRGYLRGYAKIAEKTPDDLIHLYEVLRGASPDELAHQFKPASSSIKRRSSLFSVLARLAIFGLIIAGLVFFTMIPGVQNWFANTWNSITLQASKRSNQATNNPDLIGNMPAPLPMEPDNNTGPTDAGSTHKTTPGLKLVNSDLPMASKPAGIEATDTSNAKKKTDENKAISTTTPSDETIKQLDKALTAQTDAASTENTSNSKTAKIKLVFKKEVWLRIKDKNKKTVYEGQTAAGKEKQLELEKPLTFRIGNAQGIRIFIDGKPKDISSFIKGSIANFTIE
jgi:cytoskeletal protein RodZ